MPSACLQNTLIFVLELTKSPKGFPQCNLGLPIAHIDSTDWVPWWVNRPIRCAMLIIQLPPGFDLDSLLQLTFSPRWSVTNLFFVVIL